MDITSIAAAASANAAEQTQTAVGLTVLKKAIDLEAAGALALLQAVPPPPAASASGGGGKIDTWA
ncbi:MAG: putative motility protein [Azoarcus sp.]|jgi:redox-regulated HSP33 family molecular chaperone|nr:putative motility protein [Azoarcus sp.]